MPLNYNFIKLLVKCVLLGKNIRFILYFNPMSKSHLYWKTISESFSFSKYASFLPTSAYLHNVIYLEYYKIIIGLPSFYHLIQMTSPQRYTFPYYTI